MLLFLLFLVSVVLNLLLISYSVPETRSLLSIAKENPITIIVALVALAGLAYTHASHRRERMLYTGQRKPLIDSTPMGLLPDPQRKAAAITFTVVNYSGFTARNVDIDLKYGANDWIGQWVKAKDDSLKKKNQQSSSNPDAVTFIPVVSAKIRKLKPGKTMPFELSTIKGSVDLEAICKNREKGHDIFVRTTWENDCGHRFDEVNKYKLLCTEVDGGKSFTFVPKGNISRKK
jgi:hypothetical protein